MDHRVIACWRHMLPGDRYRWTTEGWLAGCMLLSERYRWIGLLAFPLHGERYRWTTEGWLAGCTCYLAKGSDGPEDWLAGCTCYLAKGSDGPEDWLAGCTCYLAKGSESDGPRRAGLLAAHVTWRKVQMDHRRQACYLAKSTDGPQRACLLAAHVTVAFCLPWVLRLTRGAGQTAQPCSNTGTYHHLPTHHTL